MWSWIKSLWTDQARFEASVVALLGTIGTTVPTIAAMNIPDIHVPGFVVVAGAVCNVIALRFGYTVAPGGGK